MLEELRARWRLRTTKRTRVADLRTGTIAKVVGTVRTAEPLVTPFTGRACVCFTVLGYRAGDQGQLELIDDVDVGQTFFLEDETGTVRIDRKGYAWLWARSARIIRGSDHRAAEHMARYLARHGRESAPFFDGFSDTWDALRFPGRSYNEHWVPLDARVAVVGAVRDTGEPAPDVARAAGYREAKRLFSLEPPDAARLLISDRPTHLR